MGEGIRIGGGAKKEGLYVWKKYNQLTLTPTIESGYTTFAISCKTSDLAELTSIAELVGTTLSTFYYANNNYPCVLTSETTATLNNTVYAVTYNTTTKVITVDVDLSGGFTILSGGEAKAFLDFVVSDDETAYPDGGIKDGYWYGKMGIDLSVIGITKSEVNEFIFSSDSSTRTAISHSLGKEPKIAILFTNDTISKGNDNMVVQMSYIKKQGSGSYDLRFGECISWQGGSTTSFPPTVTVTDSSIVFNNGAYYQAGKKYTLVTMG